VGNLPRADGCEGTHPVEECGHKPGKGPEKASEGRRNDENHYHENSYHQRCGVPEKEHLATGLSPVIPLLMEVIPPPLVTPVTLIRDYALSIATATAFARTATHTGHDYGSSNRWSGDGEIGGNWLDFHGRDGNGTGGNQLDFPGRELY